MERTIYFSWFLLLLALLAFGAVVYEAGEIRIAATERASAASQAEQQLDRSAHSQRVSAIAADTKKERDQLDAFAHLDIVRSVQLLEGAGRGAGVNATVTSANAEGDSIDLPGGEQLQTVVFSVVGEGSFANVMHAVELYEHLPLASEVLQLDIERASGAKEQKAAWRMTIRIRVLTIVTGL